VYELTTGEFIGEMLEEIKDKRFVLRNFDSDQTGLTWIKWLHNNWCSGVVMRQKYGWLTEPVGYFLHTGMLDVKI
jgi:hypothetical protein